MREGTLEMRERGVQMRHFRAIAQDLAALNSHSRSVLLFCRLLKQKTASPPPQFNHDTKELIKNSDVAIPFSSFFSGHAPCCDPNIRKECMKTRVPDIDVVEYCTFAILVDPPTSFLIYFSASPSTTSQPANSLGASATN